MTAYENELQLLKSWDTVEFTDTRRLPNGETIEKIITAGHGYYVVPKLNTERYIVAKHIANYGFVGKLAVYLEEDCEIEQYIKLITK